jgi:hypothetical protein
VPVHGNRTLPVETLLSILNDGNVDVAAFNEVVYRAMKYAVPQEAVTLEIEFVQAQA